MFGAALRLMAVGEAGRRLGDYVKNLTVRYLVLAIAGTIFLGAAVFAMLAIFWELSSRNGYVMSAVIMAVGMALIGLLTALIAYGTTRQTKPSAKQAMKQPVQTLQGQIPTVDDVGRQIEHAVREYGPLPVAAAAAAGGVVVALIAKRFGGLQALATPRQAYNAQQTPYIPPIDWRKYEADRSRQERQRAQA